MAYLVWVVIGALVALLLNVVLQRPHTPRGFAPVLAGIFGALVGGLIGARVGAATVSLLAVESTLGALIGATVLCWALLTRPLDA